MKTQVHTTTNKNRFFELVELIKELWINKNAGYSGKDNPDPYANFRLSEWFGVTPSRGVMVRMSDKFKRLSNLAKDPNNDKVGENMKDTLLDMAVYCLILICLLEEEEE